MFFSHQELLSLAKRKRSDSEEKEPPVSKPTASSDSETSDSDDEVSRLCCQWTFYGLFVWVYLCDGNMEDMDVSYSMFSLLML